MKSLYGNRGDGRSPRINVRLPRPLYEQLTARAELEGVKVSELVRRELETAGAGRAPPDTD